MIEFERVSYPIKRFLFDSAAFNISQLDTGQLRNDRM